MIYGDVVMADSPLADKLGFYPEPSYPSYQPMQQMAGMQQPFTAPMGIDIDSVIKSISNELKADIEEFAHQLVGEDRISYEEKGIIKEKYEAQGNPRVNQTGRWAIISFIKAQATAWSDIKDFEVRTESAESVLRFIEDVFVNKEKWGVATEDMSSLVLMVERFIEYKIIRKIAEKKVWDVVQRTVSEQHTSLDSPKEKKGWGFFGR